MNNAMRNESDCLVGFFVTMTYPNGFEYRQSVMCSKTIDMSKCLTLLQVVRDCHEKLGATVKAEQHWVDLLTARASYGAK